MLADYVEIFYIMPTFFQFHFERLWFGCTIIFHSQLEEDLIESMIFFLHFLVMAPALLRLSGLDEYGHALEYFVCPAEVLLDEMTVVYLQEPVVQFILLLSPVPLLDVLGLFL